MTAELTAEFNRILDEEKRSLLEGRYEQLPGIAEQKEAYLSRLAKAEPALKMLKQLKRRLQVNQDLAEAALRGVHAAGNRLEALEKVRDGLTTYDPSGKVAVVPTHQRGFEKKA